MGSIPSVLAYFAANAIATLAGMLYWMAVENFQRLEAKQKTHHKLALVLVLSLLISPMGAWVVSIVVRLRKIAPTLKETSN